MVQGLLTFKIKEILMDLWTYGGTKGGTHGRTEDGRTDTEKDERTL